jgi:hypothetical protein
MSDFMVIDSLLADIRDLPSIRQVQVSPEGMFLFEELFPYRRTRKYLHSHKLEMTPNCFEKIRTRYIEFFLSLDILFDGRHYRRMDLVMEDLVERGIGFTMGEGRRPPNPLNYIHQTRFSNNVLNRVIGGPVEEGQGVEQGSHAHETIGGRLRRWGMHALGWLCVQLASSILNHS